MNKYDYSRPLATAKRLIARYGRTIDIIFLSDVAADPDNPLAGPTADNITIDNVPATFVQPSSLQLLGISVRNEELFSQSSQIALVAPIEGQDLNSAKFIKDQNITWKINIIEALKPADTTVLYYIGVSSP